MSNIEILVENVSKSFKEVIALDNVSVRFETGSLYGLIGPAGAGKTTLFRIMLDLMRANSGAVLYRENGRQIRFHNIAEHIAYMPQSQSLYADLSVDEHLDFFRKLYGISDADFAHKKDELVRLARLGNFLDRPAGKLSGGWQRRLSIAMALISEPEILFLDEPTLGLDVLARSDLWDLIHSLKGKVTIILTTHYMEEAETLSDRIAIMKDGKLLVCDTADKIKEMAGTDTFEQAFIRIVKGVAR